MPKTFGQYLLNDAIPTGYRPKDVYSKKDLRANMLRLAKDDPARYTKTITEVKRLGDEFATNMGVSVGLDDIEPMYKTRDAILKPALERIKKTKTKMQRQAIISATQDKLLAHAYTHPGTMGDMARSGARGSQLQLMRAVGAPAASSDEHDNLQGWLTMHSYSEGLRPSEWWANNREARMAEVNSRNEVTEPGDLSKILINNTSDQIVTSSDCGTRNGLLISVTDIHILDRYTARIEHGLSRNTLMTPRVVSALQKKKVDRMLMRSPMTCEAQHGICQHCAGLNTQGVLNKVGINLGIRASQSLGEPLTQLALNARHGVRLSGSNPLEATGLEGFRRLIESPASFKNKATLAPENGKVTAITKAPQGGYYIKVNATQAYIPQGLKPVVSVGALVHAGDVLSEGTPRPNEVVQYKGLGAGRAYLVDKLSGIYKDSNINVDRRHFEVLAKSTLNHVRIEAVDDEDSASHGLVRGDVLDYNRFRNIVGNKAQHTGLDRAEGKYLGEGALHHLVGTQITRPMIKELKDAGFTKVQTAVQAPFVSAVVLPATRNPLLNPDWLLRMGHRYLKQSLTEGAQKGQTSNIHGTSPVPGLVFSSEFGEGEDGRY